MPSSGVLTAAFLEHAPPASPARSADDLEAELRARVDAGASAWTGFSLDPVRFVRHLAERSGDALPALQRSADLYVACACMEGLPAALQAFDRGFRGDVGRAIARTDSSASFLDELMQVVAMKLFVKTDEGPPAIAEYAGRASLRGWLSTVAKRTALNLKRGKANRDHAELTSGIKDVGGAAGPDLALLKARYKEEFETSIRAAWVGLPETERSLLLLHLANKVTLPQLATMHGVSRATITRKLAAAREALVEATRRDLIARLEVSPSEYDSLMALLQSQLEVSIVHAFGQVAPGK
jgi:RNA polymerase sigma-70 factor, ECF subfamily